MNWVPNREKVINELVEHIESALDVDSDFVYCVRTDLLQYTVAMLKEQEAVEPEIEVLNEIDRLYRCSRCHKHFFYEKQKYCDECGQEVKWE